MSKLITRFKTVDGNSVGIVPANVFCFQRKRRDDHVDDRMVTVVWSSSGAELVLDDPDGGFLKWLEESLE